MKNKRETGKIILKGILVAGAVTVAATSPYFISRALPKIIRYARYNFNKKNRKKFIDSFSYLRKQGLINIENKKGQIFISLTEEGKKKAGKYQINDLKITKPKKWDKKWRMVIFDIANNKKIKREALRGKIKELGLFQLQKSVWIYPYDFWKEMDMLREFFGLNRNEMQVIVASKIENDEEARNFFNAH